MKSDKSFIIIMSLIVAIIIGLTFYYFSDTSSTSLQKENNNITGNKRPNNTTGSSSNNSNSNQTNNNTTGSGSSTDRIALSNVNDYATFFTINTLINDYYKDMIDDNKDAILEKLDSSYIKTHKITNSNVKNFMEQNYESISYVTRHMYVKGANKVLYYFISGETQNYDFAAKVLTESNGINYMIIVDQNNKTYSITPIMSNISMFDYAQEYKMGNKSIEKNDSNKYHEDNINDKNIAIYYVNYFKNMLYLNTEKAYAMLDENSKNLYDSYEAFVNNLPTLYENISTNLFSYSATGEDGNRKYSVISTNQNKISFTEETIMNFKVNIVN